jgi:hypothetical protein
MWFRESSFQKKQSERGMTARLVHKWTSVFVFLLYLCASARAQKTARGYYNELDKANGLEGFTNEFVCFRDEANDDQFMTFSKTQDIARLYPWDNFPVKERAAAKAQFEKPALMMLGYKKGVQIGEPYFLERQDPPGNSWVMPTKLKNMRIHFTINWQTLRYRWSVERQKNGIWSAAADAFGKCEDRTATVR